jgi:tRNA A58 N-methylase Trm61
VGISADRPATAKLRRVYALYMNRPPPSTSILYPEMGNIARATKGVVPLDGSMSCRRTRASEGEAMLDAILLAVGVGFFALSIAYAFGCDRL